MRAHDVADLRCKLWVAADLVRARQARLQSVGAKYFRGRRTGQAELFAEKVRRPACAPGRGRPERRLNNLLDCGRRDSVVLATSLRQLGEASDAVGHEAPTNARHLLLGQADPQRDLGAGNTISAQQHDSCSPNMTRVSGASRCQRLKLAPLLCRENDARAMLVRRMMGPRFGAWSRASEHGPAVRSMVPWFGAWSRASEHGPALRSMVRRLGAPAGARASRLGGLSTRDGAPEPREARWCGGLWLKRRDPWARRRRIRLGLGPTATCRSSSRRICPALACPQSRPRRSRRSRGTGRSCPALSRRPGSSRR